MHNEDSTGHIGHNGFSLSNSHCIKTKVSITFPKSVLDTQKAPLLIPWWFINTYESLERYTQSQTFTKHTNFDQLLLLQASPTCSATSSAMIPPEHTHIAYGFYS